MAQEIYVIDDDESSIPIFKELFKNEKEFKFIGVKTEQIDITLKNIPFLIIINEDSIDRDIISLCKQIRTDEDNQITPIIVVSSNTNKYHKLEVLEQSIEYYIKKPVDTEYLYYTIKPSDAECYYAIYSIAIIIDLICSAFYIKNINDKEIKENTEILNN